MMGIVLFIFFLVSKERITKGKIISILYDFFPSFVLGIIASERFEIAYFMFVIWVILTTTDDLSQNQKNGDSFLP
jgi:hypothetical protein